MSSPVGASTRTVPFGARTVVPGTGAPGHKIGWNPAVAGQPLTLSVGEQVAAREVRQQLAQVQAERDDLQASHDAFVEQLEGVRAERDGLEAERDAFGFERDALLEQLEGVRVERDGLQAERDAFGLERDALQVERDTLQAERDALQAEHNELRGAPAGQQPEECRRECERLRAQLERAQQVRRFCPVPTSVLDAPCASMGH